MADDAKMPFLAHLVELRQRLIWSIVAVGVGLVAAFSQSKRLMAWLQQPLNTELTVQFRPPFLVNTPKAKLPEVIFTAPAEAFWAHLKVALLVGLVVALPFVLYQVWRFIEPGLMPKEKRFAVPFVVLSTVSFAIGMAFCFALVLPYALSFLLTFDPTLKPMLKVGEYIDFTVKFLLAFGLIFELPLGLAIAARLGMVTPKFLSKNRKYAFFLCFVVGAILTPTPDIFNQSLMAIPMYLLYEVGILAARVMARRRAAAKADLPA
jgi:sec-independent protein translocase protein TatC